MYLLMKVGIKHNQVEVALQALHCSVEKVVFGTASLKDKKKKKHLFKVGAPVNAR